MPEVVAASSHKISTAMLGGFSHIHKLAGSSDAGGKELIMKVTIDEEGHTDVMYEVNSHIDNISVTETRSRVLSKAVEGYNQL